MTTRNHTIDFFKGLLIIIVVITHFSWARDERQCFLFPYIINMAIPIFMIISGWTYAISFERHKIDNLDSAYQYNNLIGKIIRYTIPFIILIIWEVVDKNINLQNKDFFDSLQWMISGTQGQGSYYYPILIQLVFTFPLIYFIFIKHGASGFLICFLINSLYELLIWAYGMNEQCYRLLLFRYVFLIGSGVYAYKGYKLNLRSSLIITIIGFLFITATTYWGYEPKIINFWISTCFLSSMWIVPISIWIFQNLDIHFEPLELFGRASYHIFLVQMIYYLGYCSIVGEKLPNRISHLLCGIVICLVIGLVFYFLESFLSRKFLLVLNKHANRSV